MSQRLRTFLSITLLVVFGTTQIAAIPSPGGSREVRNQSSDCTPISDAVAKGLVSLTLTANGNLFFRNPIHYVVKNLSSIAQQVCFPAGQLLLPDDPLNQALIIVGTISLMVQFSQTFDRPVTVELRSNQTVEGDLNAMCINESKEAPPNGGGYHLGKMATGTLLKMAQAIDSQSAQGRIGAQMAIWAITDQLTLDGFSATPSSSQPSLVDSIRPFLCLAQDDVNLGQQLLQETNAGVSLYTGENPIKSYCQSQGIPSISDMIQQAKLWGERALIVIALAVCGFLVVLVLLIVLLIRLIRRK